LLVYTNKNMFNFFCKTRPKLSPIIGLPIEEKKEETCVTFIPFRGPKTSCIDINTEKYSIYEDYFTSNGTFKLYLNDYDIENQRIIEIENSPATLDLLIEILEKIEK
jgi:hypothetical protein